MARPETRYVRTVDDVHIAYQVIGDGPFDLVYVPGWISNVDLPYHGPFLRRLASMSRLITFDRRGSGVSDRPPREESLALEYGIDDIRAVMDAAGSERAVLFGFEDGGILSTVFAGSHPDRTLALVLFATWARFRSAPDYPWGWTDEQIAEWEGHIGAEWGTGRVLALQPRGDRPVTDRRSGVRSDVDVVLAPLCEPGLDRRDRSSPVRDRRPCRPAFDPGADARVAP